ncbi:MAG TPA: transglycosylase domain-containing protein [Pseudonocardiaceae bacterium]|nr:transglycosylase domain-containing protein [Pseudonocardiaceae bacterium]
MSDQREDSGRRLWNPNENCPPERFAHNRQVNKSRQEPELLTHAASRPADHGDRQDKGNRPPADGTARRRWIRTVALVGLLLAVLTPVLAFFAGWLFLTVPSPAALAAQQKQVTTIMAGDGTTEIGRYVPEQGNRIAVDLDQVPVHVQNAVLAAEDRSFRSNPGFDVAGITRAAWKQLTGGSGGGSTITQQYVKVATGHDEYSIFRKFREMVVAAKITKQNSKDRILADYLNTIYFGRGAYGIQAASQAYFRKNVQQLTVSEAAVLAAAIRSPSRLDPAKNLQQSEDRWNFVLDGMVSQNWLSQADRDEAQYPATIAPGQAPGSPTDDRAHIVDRVLEELEKNGIDRERLAVNGGRINTTIDARAQSLARDAVLTTLGGQPPNLHSSLVAIDPRSGGVTAYYGGSEGDGFDLAGGPVWNPGSAFKPFTMMAALEQGIGLNTIYDGNSPLVIDGRPYANSESRDYSRLTLHDAMTQSVNTAFVRLAEKVGPQAIRNAAIRAGIPEQVNGKRSLSELDSGQPALGITLGQYPVHTIDMASAYATFAADGMRHDPFFVREYVNARGEIDYTHVDESKQAFDQTNLERNSQLARNLTATLTDVARSSQIPLDGGRQVAVKTGTHQRGDTGSNSAAWTVGYTPSISTAVWVGDPANSALKNSSGGDVFGRGLPGAIWQRFMNSYLTGTPMETFPEFTLIGPAPPPPVQAAPSTSPKRESVRTRPSAQPEPDFEHLPVPVDPPEEQTKPSLRKCFPFCDSSPPEDEEEGGARR